MPLNNELIQRADLLNRIQQLTTTINQGAGSLNLSATSANNFAKGLELISSRANATTADMARLNQQMLKVVASIETGNAAQIRMGEGTRIRTGQFIQPYQQGLTQQGIGVLNAKEAEAARLQARLENITRQTTQRVGVYSSGGETQADYNKVFNQFYGTQPTKQPQQGTTGLGTRMPAWGGFMNGSFATGQQYYDPSKGGWWQDWQRWNQQDNVNKARARQQAASMGGASPGAPTGGRPFDDSAYQPFTHGWNSYGWGPVSSGATGYAGGGGPGFVGGRGGRQPPPQYPSNPAGPFQQYPFDPFQPFRQGNTGIPNTSKPAWWDATYKKAQYYGFGAEDLQSINTEASTGTSRINFQQVDQVTGAMKNLNLTVDKTGNVLVDTQRRFRDFFSSVGRDTVEFLKWSIAVTLILGPLRQLQQLIQTAIENETKLASISVTLAGSQKTVADVFAASAEIAGKAGEEINTVLDAYQIAYRAVGNTADDTVRFAQANKLLSDSLILSKLTGMDEATAIDTLSAALRQAFTGEGSLARGTELLDKWIATTKVANVDLGTLATGFAIVGDAADAAGLGVDELNGLIAAIAETGVASGKEVANAARAMISGFQSDQAKKLLASLGISTESEGQVRSFKDILEEIARLRQSGVLSGEQFNQITLTLGGGYRRQAVWSTLIDNYQRVGQVAEASSNAAGDAQDALSKKTETVQTSITRMGNAFQELAQNLGTKGGVLDIFKDLVTIATVLVKAFDAISGSMGKAFPVAAVAGIAALFMMGKNQATRSQYSIGGLFSNFIPEQATQQQTTNIRTNAAGMINRLPSVRIATGLAVAALPAITNLQDETLSNEQKAIKIGMGIAGGVLGAFLGEGIGAVIGVTIAESFSAAIINEANKNYTGAFGKMVAKVTGKEITKEGVVITPTQQRIGEAEKAISNYKVNIGQVAGLVPATEAILETIRSRMATFMKPEEITKVTEDQFLDIAISVSEGTWKTLLENLRDAKLADKTAIQAKTGQIDPEIINKFYASNRDMIDQIIADQSEQLFKDFEDKKLNKSAYATGISQLKNLNILGSGWYNAFVESTQSVIPSMQGARNYGGSATVNAGPLAGMDVSEFFKKSGIISSRGGPEVISAINEYAVQIQKQKAIISSGTSSEQERADAQKQLAQLSKEFIPLFNQAYTDALANIQLLSITEAYGITPVQSAAITKRAQTYEDETLEANRRAGIITQEQIDAFKAERAAFQVQGGEKASQFLNIPKGTVSQPFYERAMKDMQAEGLLPKFEKPGPVQFQQYDLTTKQFTKYLTEDYPKLMAQLEGKGYVRNEDMIIPVLKDGILQQMKVDSKVYQLLLSKIEENTQKMTGEFNLPEGMNFNINTRIAELWKNSFDKTAALGTGKLGVGGVGGVTPGYTEINAEVPSYGIGGTTGYVEPGWGMGGVTPGYTDIYPTTPTDETGFLKNLIDQYNPANGETGFLKNMIEQGTGGNGVSILVDKLSAIQGTLMDFADRPINLNITTTSILYMDNKVIGEAVSRYLGTRLSALGGSFVGGTV